VTMRVTTGVHPSRRGRGGGRSRKLLFSVAAALLLVGAAVLAPRADAADDGRDVSWELSGGGPGAYNSMINAVRQRATGGAILREGVLQTNAAATGFFTVNIGSRLGVIGDVQVPRARLIIRERDLFVLGFVNGDPDDTERVFFFRGDDNGYRGASEQAEPITMPFTGSYIDLERTGNRARTATTLSLNAWEGALSTLENATSTTSSQDLARALTMFIMAVSEGARFDTIQDSFVPTFSAGGGEQTVTPTEAELMNSWDEASQQLLDALNNARPVNFEINDPATPGVDLQATSVAALALILGIALVKG